MKRWTVEELAGMIDHTYVKADATRKQMEKLCKEAREYHFAMAAINSSQTALCAEYLRDSDVHVELQSAFRWDRQQSLPRCLKRRMPYKTERMKLIT